MAANMKTVLSTLKGYLERDGNTTAGMVTSDEEDAMTERDESWSDSDEENDKAHSPRRPESRSTSESELSILTSPPGSSIEILRMPPKRKDATSTSTDMFIESIAKALKMVPRKLCETRMRGRILYFIIGQFHKIYLDPTDRHEPNSNDLLKLLLINDEDCRNAERVGKLNPARLKLSCVWEEYMEHELIRKVIDSLRGIPSDPMYDSEKYRMSRIFYSPLRLTLLILEDISHFKNEMSQKWFLPVVNILGKRPEDPFYKAPHYYKRLSSYLMIVMQEKAFQIAHSSLQYFIEKFADPRTMPLMYLSVYYRKGKFFLRPPLGRIQRYFNGLIRQIASLVLKWMEIGRYVFEWKRSNSFNEFLKDYIRHNQEAFNRIFSLAFAPIVHHNGEKELNYAILSFQYGKYERLKTRRLLWGEKNVDKLFRRYYFWKKWQTAIRKLPNYEFVTVFCVNQSPAKKGMLAAIKLKIQDVLCDLMLEHLQFTWQIRASLIHVMKKCRIKPKSAEELIAAGEFMVYACTSWLEKMRHRVMQSINFGIKLMEIVVFNKSHLQLMCENFWMLNNMKTHFGNFDDMYEQTRSEMGENLQRVTDNLLRDMEEFSRQFQDGLNFIDKKSYMPQYRHYMMRFLRAIDDFEERVGEINKEETLLRLTVTTYPELTEMKTRVTLFTRQILKLRSTKDITIYK